MRQLEHSRDPMFTRQHPGASYNMSTFTFTCICTFVMHGYEAWTTSSGVPGVGLLAELFAAGAFQTRPGTDPPKFFSSLNKLWHSIVNNFCHDLRTDHQELLQLPPKYLQMCRSCSNPSPHSLTQTHTHVYILHNPFAFSLQASVSHWMKA